jgi:Fungal trichothecene efflux pump (TRI12)
MYAATLTWRIGAWIPMALAAFGFLKLFFAYHPPARAIDLTYNERPLVKRVDYIGGALSISSIALFMIGFQWAGYNYVWHSVEVISTITAGSALFVIFCIWECYTPNPMIPLAIFSNWRNVIVSFVVLAAGGAGFYAIAGFWIVEVQTLFSTESVYYLAKLYLPFGFSFLIGILIFTTLIDFTRGAIGEVFVVAAALMGAGIGGLIAFTQNTPALSSGMSFLAGLGIGGLFVGPIVALTTVTSDDLLGTIIGAGLAVRLIGGQIAYSIYYNLLTPKVTKELPVIVGTAVMQAGLPALEVAPFLEDLVTKNLTGIAGLKGISPEILLAASNGVDEAYILGFKEVYYAGVAFSALALVACLFLGNIRKYLSDRVAVNLS